MESKNITEKTFIDFLKPETFKQGQVSTMAVGEEGGEKFETLFPKNNTEIIDVSSEKDYYYTTTAMNENGGKFDTLFPEPKNDFDFEVDLNDPNAWYNPILKDEHRLSCAVGINPEGGGYLDDIIGIGKTKPIYNDDTATTLALGEEGGTDIGDIEIIGRPKPINPIQIEIEPEKKSAAEKLNEVKDQIIEFAKANPRPNPDKMTIPTNDVIDVQAFLKEVQSLLNKNYPNRFKAEITNNNVKNKESNETSKIRKNIEIKPTKRKKNKKIKAGKIKYQALNKFYWNYIGGFRKQFKQSDKDLSYATNYQKISEDELELLKKDPLYGRRLSDYPDMGPDFNITF